MLSAALKIAGEPEAKPRKFPNEWHQLRRLVKEIDPANITRVGSKSIGSGTFGTCFLAKYREITIVIKEYKETANSPGHNQLLRLQREAAYEARVIQHLGDHPGIPLLFGVMLQQRPVSIVLKVHGQGDESLTVYKAATRSKIKHESEWKEILWNIADALEHIHRCGE